MTRLAVRISMLFHKEENSNSPNTDPGKQSPGKAPRSDVPHQGSTNLGAFQARVFLRSSALSCKSQYPAERGEPCALVLSSVRDWKCLVLRL